MRRCTVPFVDDTLRKPESVWVIPPIVVGSHGRSLPWTLLLRTFPAEARSFRSQKAFILDSQNSLVVGHYLRYACFNFASKSL